MSVLSPGMLVFGYVLSFLAGAAVCLAGAGLWRRFGAAGAEAAGEQARRTPEADRLRGVSQSLPGIEFQYRVDPGGAGRYRFVGALAEALLGLSPDADDFEEQFLARVPEAYRDRHDHCVRAARSGARPEQVELPFDRPDGKRVWLLLTSVLERRPEAGGEALVFNGFMLDITERKEQERTLRILSEAVEQTTDGVVVTEAPGRDDAGEADGGTIAYVNRAFEEMTGYAEEELIGRTPQLLRGPETDPDVIASLEQALAAQEPWTGETVNYRKDGTRYSARWTTTPMFDEAGALQYWVSIQRDVTEKQEREQALRRQRRLLEQAQRLTGAWMADLRTGEVAWSDEGYRVHELAPGAELGLEEGFDFVHPADRSAVRAAFERCVEAGASYDVEHRIITAEGNRRWVRTVGAPVEEDGDIVKVAGALQDITERKRRERELERQNDLFERAQEIADVGAWEYDVEADTVRWTENARRMMALPARPSDSLDEALRTCHPDDRPTVRTAVEDAVEEGTPFDLEARLIAPDGERRWVHARGEPQSEDGTVVRVRGTIQDITDRRRRQEALRTSKSQYQTLVDNFPDGAVFLFDEDLTFQLAGGEGLAAVGLSPEEVTGRTLHDLFPEDIADRQAEYYRRALEGEKSVLEEQYQGGDYRVQVLPVRDEDGTVIAGMAVSQDVTDEKEQERRLRQAEMLFQNAQDALFLVDVEEEASGTRFRVQRVNPAYEQKTGFSEADIRGQTPRDVLGEEAGAEAEKRYRACVRRQEPLEYEESVPLDGETTHWTTRIAPVVVDGTVQQIVGTTRDVTERKRRARTLRERWTKVEALYETTDRLLRASSEDEIGAVLVQIVREALGHPGASVRIACEGSLEVVHVSEATREFMPERPAFDVDGDSAVAEVYRSGDTLAISDLEAVDVEDPHDYGDLRSVVVVPMGAHGTFAVSSPDPGAISEFDARLIEVLGSYATVVLDRLDRETSLREERDLLNRLLSTSPAAIVMLDEEGAFVRANERAQEVMGLEEAEVAERAFNDPEWGITTLDGRPIPDAELPFRRVLRTGEPVFGYEHAIERPDGTRRLLSISGAPLQGVDGATQGALFHLNDITEQKAQERTLRERTEKIEVLYEATRRLLRAASREEVAAEVHGVLQDVFAYPFRHTAFMEAGEIIPKKTTAEGDADLPAPDPQPVDGDTVAARALEAGEAVVVPDTAALENDINYGDLRSAAGVPIGQHGVIIAGTPEEGDFDRLNLRLLEVLGGYAALVLERLRREEELRVAKEGAEAARADAEQARDDARKAARLKSAFLANMSHEIRTPLTSIIGFAEVLGAEVGALDASAAGSLEQKAHLIEQGGKRLLDTLEGVLNLSKLEAGQMELDRRPVDLADRARRTAEELKPKATDKGVRLQVETGTGPVRARADEGGVQIVVQNLLSNAIKYTNEGGRVRVRTYREDGAAVLEVEDTGIGMEPEAAKELFEPFRQASEGIGRKYEGSGVGLAVTQKATEEMDGDIEVDTEKGDGSRFVVRLPRAESAADAEA
ncbi:PAS domain S-box-containing protein [Salinibacter ruber]|uniref:PAS domain S-box protein n=1 Tax=Salinibacter ruber TaxID=146919 RepID=UPI000E5705DB|nr:PAS domain S-box protein [Salinibacter ruber]MCS3698850.1 PAS domain S-box-containing protein [Salinibacter ruber]